MNNDIQDNNESDLIPQVDLKTELESSAPIHKPQIGDNMHQFANKGLHYQRHTSTVLVLVGFLVAAAVIAYFLFNTSQGQSLINRLSSSTTS